LVLRGIGAERRSEYGDNLSDLTAVRTDRNYRYLRGRAARDRQQVSDLVVCVFSDVGGRVDDCNEPAELIVDVLDGGGLRTTYGEQRRGENGARQRPQTNVPRDSGMEKHCLVPLCGYRTPVSIFPVKRVSGQARGFLLSFTVFELQ
jgi:hypothetical protein